MTRHSPTVETIRLDGEWTLRLAGGLAPEGWTAGTIGAEVPGSVHTDLMAAGLIPDPYLDNNEALTGWIGLCDWEYTRVFQWSSYPGVTASLVFEGLDTIARVTLNGIDVASTSNMHRTYTIDVSEQLRDGDNILTVTFASAVKFADRASLELGFRPHVNHHPYNAIRKMACSFGWDWGIDTASAGIWKSVSLVHSAGARLATVRVTARPQNGDGVVAIEAILAHAVSRDVFLDCEVGGVQGRGTIRAGSLSGSLALVVPQPELWWPAGYGAQPLYDTKVGLVLDDKTIDDRVRRVGFRTVDVDTAPDEFGAPFNLLVNGVPVLVKGANWIPDDAFPHRVDRERYRTRLAQARFANINLLRVWGGGIYEKDEFFEACDEMGILTWQDFLFACAAYSEDSPLADEIAAEARDNITRIAHHPSLVVMNGNNENLWGFEEWNWQPRLGKKTWGAGYYFELLPRLVEELAPQVAYTPGSPYSPSAGARANDQSHGTMHIWDLWNQRDYPAYREYRPRFVSEFGWQGPPTWSTMVAAIKDDPLTPESPGMIVHQKAALGNTKLTDGLIAHFDLPDDIDEWHWAMSLNQAVAITLAVEHFRSLAPVCTGTILWQLNDCWPVTSWSAIDGNGRPKPLLHALAKVYADRLVSIQPRESGLVAIYSNDSNEAWRADYVLQRLDYSGDVLAETRGSLTVPARSVQSVEFPRSLSTPDRPSRELLRAQADDLKAHWFFCDYRDSELAAPRWSTDLNRNASAYTLRITAENLVRDVSLLIDKVDTNAHVDTMLTTLLPGEEVKVCFESKMDLSIQELVSPHVLRSANQLVRPLRS
ncbi:glycoside hydrolase family 2 protein [soil metagenome]